MSSILTRGGGGGGVIMGWLESINCHSARVEVASALLRWTDNRKAMRRGTAWPWRGPRAPVEKPAEWLRPVCFCMWVEKLSRFELSLFFLNCTAEHRTARAQTHLYARIYPPHSQPHPPLSLTHTERTSSRLLTRAAHDKQTRRWSLHTAEIFYKPCLYAHAETFILLIPCRSKGNTHSAAD